MQDRAAAASKDELLKEAIESLVDWKEPEKKKYDYRIDPRLDQVDATTPGLWIFDQPWPENVHEVVMEQIEVFVKPRDTSAIARCRKLMFGGLFRRVTVVRTGVVEQMEVTGHWWDHDPHHAKIGMLSRSVVRELNRNPRGKRFAARINRIQEATYNDQDCLALYIDLAIDDRFHSQKLAMRYR